MYTSIYLSIYLSAEFYKCNNGGLRMRIISKPPPPMEAGPTSQRQVRSCMADTTCVNPDACVLIIFMLEGSNSG